MTKRPSGRNQSAVTPKKLSPSDLFRECSFEDHPFDTTADLEDFQGLLGQARAEAAVEFGIGIEREGFNVFAFGPPGSGKYSAIREYLEVKAATATTPPDICYVNNFSQRHCPNLVRLPSGRGQEFRDAMTRLIEELRTALQAALESEEYQNRRQSLEQRFEEKQSQALTELGERAAEQGLALVRTPVGIVFAPVRADEVLSPEEFQGLADSERQKIENDIEKFKEELQKVLQQFPRMQRALRDELRKLNLEVSRFTIRPLFEELRERFVGLDEVQSYLVSVEAHVAENSQRIIAKPESESKAALETLVGDQDGENPFLRRYRVNVLVSRKPDAGSPVVYEDNPTYQNLVGRVEHIPQMGAAVTDFNLIKPGAFHRANGGYLLIDAIKLLSQPYAYEGLKRTLQSRYVKIESLGEALSLISTYSLEPEPLEMNVKIVLLGEPYVYYLLSAYDPEFTELFKVVADFAGDIHWTPGSELSYARLLAKLIREEGLRPFDRGAVARLIEHSARSVGDAKKMSLLMSRILDMMREADYWASKEHCPAVSRTHVEQAIDASIFRRDRVRELIYEQIQRRTILIDTEGQAVGQVNGLSVLQLGDFSFGQPSRITARVRLGKGEVINIEREVELSGPIHSKGVLILAGFLGARFAADAPLSLAASLVFEQSYGGVDGDSASSAELYALLSAIAEAPIRQALAVTGSVNQHGQVQAIGGVNEKIEGFFDICRGRGLTGDQGVLIPEANVEHLMLRQEVIDAVREDRFHIYPVATIDQGIEILTGIPAGVAASSGRFPKDSINRRVADRLEEWRQKAREFAQGPTGSSPADGTGSGGEAT